MTTLKPLTGEQIKSMTPDEIADYMANMARQAEVEKAAIQSKSKARIEWETYPLVYKNFGFGAVYFNAPAEPDGKSRYISLFLYETVGREVSYPLVRIECDNPKKSNKSPDRLKLAFIQSMLAAAGVEWAEFTRYHDSSWKGLPFNRLEALEGTAIVKFTYPVRLGLRLRETPSEWVDKATGETRQGTRRRYGFALQFSKGEQEAINDYEQAIQRLEWR